MHVIWETFYKKTVNTFKQTIYINVSMMEYEFSN